MKPNPAFEFDWVTTEARRNGKSRAGSPFEQQFIQQLLAAVRPEIKALIKEVITDEGGPPLVVDYEEAGRMIGTTYEGIRKLVRKGKLTAVSRSGRHRGIAVSELKDYVQRNQLLPEWYSSYFRASGNG
jgi:hypothetical protein